MTRCHHEYEARLRAAKSAKRPNLTAIHRLFISLRLLDFVASPGRTLRELLAIRAELPKLRGARERARIREVVDSLHPHCVISEATCAALVRWATFLVGKGQYKLASEVCREAIALASERGKAALVV